MNILKHLKVVYLILPFKNIFSNQYLASFDKSGNRALFGNDDDYPTHFPTGFETKSGEYFYSRTFFLLKTSGYFIFTSILY